MEDPEAFCCQHPCLLYWVEVQLQFSWVDGFYFKDWLLLHSSLTQKRLTSRKVLIGENSACHFHPAIIIVCEDNEIDFMCLSTNSTHITQSLDVYFLVKICNVFFLSCCLLLSLLFWLLLITLLARLFMFLLTLAKYSTTGFSFAIFWCSQ